MKTFLNAFKDNGHLHLVMTDCESYKDLYNSLMQASDRFSPELKVYTGKFIAQHEFTSFLDFCKMEYKVKSRNYQSPILQSDTVFCSLARLWLKDKIYETQDQSPTQ